MKILGIRVDNIDMVQALCQVHKYAESQEPRHIITLNAEILYTAAQNPELKEIIEGADMVTPDGSGIVWAAKTLGEPLTERVSGIDLMTEICRQAAPNHWRIYLLGGAPGVAEACAGELEKRFPGLEIAGHHHGYFSQEEEGAVIEAINAARPSILFVALGAPKQEYWIIRHKAALNSRILMGVGGSLDVLSGQIKRAPLFFQKMGLEWLWRLLRQPWRIKRMSALPKFVWAVKQSQWRRKRNRAQVEEKRRRL